MQQDILRRVTVYKNGCNKGAKIVPLPHSATFADLIQTICDKFQLSSNIGQSGRHYHLFLDNGAELDDVNCIRDNDTLYISTGEDFIAIKADKSTNNSEWVTLNVGGQYFTTSRGTLVHPNEPASMLARMFAEDNNGGYLFTPSNRDSTGAYLIDREPAYFAPVLNYLRTGELVFDDCINPAGVLEEARFFGIESIIPTLEKMVSQKIVDRDQMALTRRDIVDTLIRSPYTSELRFQGVNLAGADLSRLDLRYINFKYANMRGCNLTGANLSWCCLERSDLSHAILDNAQLLGVKSLCANMEGAMLRNCNLKDPAGSRANMEGVNLKGANLEGSDMGGVNLRVANLKNANMQNCDLRAAVFAGADLESCDLSGSDLHEANLRGANLNDAAFKFMLTPLHMSQTMS